jgi:hypothetical protein
MSSYNPGREKGLIHAGLVFGKSLQEVPAIVTQENEGATGTPVAVDFVVVRTQFQILQQGKAVNYVGM